MFDTVFQGGVDNLKSFIGSDVGLILTLIFFTVIIAIYAVFVYYFYKFLAKKNIIELDLRQYNKSEHKVFSKITAAIFYVIEYLVILPVVTLFWFSILAVLILMLSEGIPVSTILIITAALVASVRVTSYISQNLSQDLAKMLPFTLLALAITKPGFFSVQTFLSGLTEIPALFSSILLYLIFIVTIELVMRVIDFIKSLMTEIEKSNPTKNTEKSNKSE